MAVYDSLLGDGAERQLQPAGFGLAHQKLLEGERMGADGLGVVVLAQRGEFVAQGQQAARLEADDRHAAGGEGREGGDETVELGPGFIDETG